MHALKRRRTDAYVPDTPIILTKTYDQRDAHATDILPDDLPIDEIDYAFELEIIDSESEQEEEPEQREPDPVEPEPLDLERLWQLHFEFNGN